MILSNTNVYLHSHVKIMFLVKRDLKCEQTMYLNWFLEIGCVFPKNIINISMLFKSMYKILLIPPGFVFAEEGRQMFLMIFMKSGEEFDCATNWVLVSSFSCLLPCAWKVEVFQYWYIQTKCALYNQTQHSDSVKFEWINGQSMYYVTIAI